ncbi:hypothetical protein VNO78_23811 [Psophocarpus tetragonolobus]|uniref:Uncharacterized protein n=1 Tax=Psophocarpus tetragonolobus TaxID=3891 RepID=A0AAN9XE53_PSOTE
MEFLIEEERSRLYESNHSFSWILSPYISVDVDGFYCYLSVLVSFHFYMGLCWGKNKAFLGQSSGQASGGFCRSCEFCLISIPQEKYQVERVSFQFLKRSTKLNGTCVWIFSTGSLDSEQ